MANNQPFRVFISHDTRDEDVAYRLFYILDRLRAAPYIYEVYPNYRQDISTAIIQVMRTCKVCLCLLSRNGIESQWVHQELGAAFAFNKVILPCVEHGMQYKGFVQFRPRISYDPMNFDHFAYEVIYAIRGELLGHQARPILTLTCPKGHTQSKYELPATDHLNEAIKEKETLFYLCENCQEHFAVSPWTLELVRG